jgi:hypothetical protein
MDGSLVLCCAYSNGKFAKEGRGWIRVYQVPSISSEDKGTKPWEAQIDEGFSGLVKCCFSRDGRHILCWSEFQVIPLVLSWVS